MKDRWERLQPRRTKAAGGSGFSRDEATTACTVPGGSGFSRDEATTACTIPGGSGFSRDEATTVCAVPSRLKPLPPGGPGHVAAEAAPTGGGATTGGPANTDLSLEVLDRKIIAYKGPLPSWLRRLRLSYLLGLGLTLLAATALYAYFNLLRPPMESARAALRIARYDTALTDLTAIPARLTWWPGLTALRAKARLGKDLNTQPQDWPALGLRLRALREGAPGDADLLVMQATMAFHAGDLHGAAPALTTAVSSDPANAEAQFLLGVVHDQRGEEAYAIAAYRQAAALAPESPQYRSNLARALLDAGKPGAAVQEYRRLSGFPLAGIEQALGHWALGELEEAAEAQGRALALLGDAAVMDSPPNRLGWWFKLADQPPPNNGVQLTNRADKGCYAQLGQAVSRRLADRSGAAWAVPGCVDPAQGPPPLPIRRLVADDLCRFVARDQPELKAAAAAVRQGLGQPGPCPAPRLTIPSDATPDRRP